VEDEMGEPVILVGGEKGGIGKSLFTHAMVDFSVAQNRKVLLIETDPAADVWKAYAKTVPSETVNLGDHEEWIRLATIISEHPDSLVVINTRAACQEFIAASGAVLTMALKKLERNLIAIWMLDRKRDCVEFLSKFMEIMPTAQMVAVRNLYAGPEKKFELYNSSNAKKAVEKKGKTINFPEVADRVTDAMNRERWTIEKALTELPFGDQMELERWREECKPVMNSVLG
jgi:hypothetical protein